MSSRECRKTLLFGLCSTSYVVIFLQKANMSSDFLVYVFVIAPPKAPAC